MRGDPWGCVRWPKWAKMANSGKIGKNGKKMIKKNERVPDSLLEINATTLSHHIMPGKNEKNAQGRPMGVHKCGKSHFSILALLVA